MESHIAFDFLHGLVDVSVQNRYRPELLQIRECLRAVVRTPSPLRINRPERNVSKDNDRRAVLQMLDVSLQAIQVAPAEGSQARRL